MADGYLTSGTTWRIWNGATATNANTINGTAGDDLLLGLEHFLDARQRD